MALVSKRAIRGRLVRSALAALFFIAGLVIASGPGQFQYEQIPGGANTATEAEKLAAKATDTEKLIALAGVALALFAGFVAARYVARAAQMVFSPAGESRSTVVRVIVTVIGYIVVLVATMSSLGYNLRGLLVGGAFTGVIIGIAAQQTLGNFFAGLVLLMVRPFTIGQYVVLRSGPLGGEYEGTVTDMSLFYVNLTTESGPVQLPNAGVLAAAVGPGARSPAEEEEIDETTQEHGPAQGGSA